MANKRVKIYERIKTKEGWKTVPVTVPRTKADGTLFLKDDRQGRFEVSWYEGSQKRRHPERFKSLSAAVRLKSDKEFYLANQHRPGVADGTVVAARFPFGPTVDDYLAGLGGSPNTKKLHRQNLREFEKWNSKICEARLRKRFVEEIDKPHMMRFMEYLMEEAPENCPFTAAWKLMRINKFIRTVLKLDPGKGPIKKADLRRELESNKIPEICSDEELKQLFSVMDEDEHVRYETLLKTGLRKKELMYLEEDDVLIDSATSGKKKREVKVERKDHYRFIPKNGKSRSIPIPLDLAEKLLKLKRTKRPSKLLFGTRTGQPDGHMLEKLRSIAKRAGMDESKFWLHKFRATYAVSRLRAGVDLETLREWLGHKDVESIKAYLVHLKNEEAIESGKVDAGYVCLPGTPKHSPIPREDSEMPVTIPDATIRELRWS